MEILFAIIRQIKLVKNKISMLHIYLKKEDQANGRD